jgi:hypothetical protein
MKMERFNIRVYGLLVHAGKVLVADELIFGPGLKGSAGEDRGDPRVHSRNMFQAWWSIRHT